MLRVIRRAGRGGDCISRLSRYDCLPRYGRRLGVPALVMLSLLSGCPAVGDGGRRGDFLLAGGQ